MSYLCQFELVIPDNPRKKEALFKWLVFYRWSTNWDLDTVNWNQQIKASQMKFLFFEERGKLEYPDKNLSEQSREPGPH